eukprot:m.564137 g.564137  ORF g.564137 m.564137 type:complete len:93 (+) comp22235_c4_seq37:759-1037(+)
MRERLARRKYQRQGLHGVPNGEWCAVHGQVVENAVPMVPLVLRGAVVFVGNTADALPLHLHGCTFPRLSVNIPYVREHTCGVCVAGHDLTYL